jgi:hypothetical protein
MKISAIPLLAVVFAFAAVSATAPPVTNEQLVYSINWPSGLSLGDGRLSGQQGETTPAKPGRLDLHFEIEAAVPGFGVADKYHSIASSEFCSLEFSKDTQHGKKKVEEKTVFDPEKQTATRETKGGGKTTLSSGTCGKDALTYLYYLRHELSQGRLPPTQTVYFGAPYQIRVEFAGTQSIKLGDTPVQADRLTASLKGPSSDVNFEVFFLKDATRTPALVRVPLSMGTFSMELVRQP